MLVKSYNIALFCALRHAHILGVSCEWSVRIEPFAHDCCISSSVKLNSSFSSNFLQSCSLSHSRNSLMARRTSSIRVICRCAASGISVVNLGVRLSAMSLVSIVIVDVSSTGDTSRQSLTKRSTAATWGIALTLHSIQSSIALSFCA